MPSQDTPRTLSIYLALPRHLRRPGEDGYRTPTIEDPEHPSHHGMHSATAFASEIHHGISDAKESFSVGGCKYHHVGHDPHYCCHEPHEEIPFEEPIKGLTWKQRIKHVTWAYFTVTMATGGVANALSAGLDKARNAGGCADG